MFGQVFCFNIIYIYILYIYKVARVSTTLTNQLPVRGIFVFIFIAIVFVATRDFLTLNT